MRFDVRSAGRAAGTVGLLLPFAITFHARRIPAFANLLVGFLCMVVFNLCLAILTYAGTPLNAPLADSQLMNCDAALGIHLPSIVAWAHQHPGLERILNLAYFSVLPSTLLALVVLGLDPDVRRLRDFVLHFILGGLITTVVFFLLPAEGPFAAYGYAPRPDQQRFLHHFHALRAGEFPVVSMTNLEGLITFPSFHTTWALLVAFAFRHYRWLFLPMVILNAAVLVATLTTGWHYGSDVVGGILTAVAAVLTTKGLSGWLHVDWKAAQVASVQLAGRPV
ncbi:MAG: phosphatase PAP2 family protein [Fuerstiella sp.]